MADPRTTRSAHSVAEFLNAIDDSQRRADCKAVAAMMRRATGEKAAMWGASIVGFGSYDYQYASGRAGRWFLCGFSPRKHALTIYIMPDFKTYDARLKKLRIHKIGK